MAGSRAARGPAAGRGWNEPLRLGSARGKSARDSRRLLRRRRPARTGRQSGLLPGSPEHPQRSAVGAAGSGARPTTEGHGERGRHGRALGSGDTDDVAPTVAQQEVYADLHRRLVEQLEKWKTLANTELPALNTRMQEAGVPRLEVGQGD